MGSNPVWLVSLQEEVIRQSSVSQGERPREKPSLPTSWLWISSLQNFEKINFYYLSHPICSILLQHPEQTNTPTSVQFSSSVVSNSLWPHGLQHTRSPCPSSTPGVYPDSCPLSRWCHPTISSFVVPFSSHLQSFPASGSFQMSQVFASGGQTIEVSASTSVLPMNTQDWSPLGWTGLISLQSKRLSRTHSLPFLN